MYKGYKYRIYPNKQQQLLIQKTFGCCRFVYNQTLAYRKELYVKEKKNMSKFDCNNYCNRVLKKQYEWLKDVDSRALLNSVINMDNAFHRFFTENKGYPKFKSKRDNYQSYTTNFVTNNIEIDNNKVKLPKLKWVKAKIHRSFKGKIKSATISQVPSGKYFVSIIVETEQDKLPVIDKKIGIDLGIKDLYISSNGEKIQNLKILKKYEKKLKKAQKVLSKKKKSSNNREKQKRKVAKIYEKITNIRKDYLHKLSWKLINENQVIVSENLQILNMMKNHSLAKSITDVSWGLFMTQLEYKSLWYGRSYIKIDTFFPSTQLCSYCGYRNEELKNLKIREWICPICGTIHDRDINSAKNILQEGLKIL